MNTKIKITLASKENSECIDQVRHQVYAEELRQFESNADKTLHDRLEVKSIYIVAIEDGKLIGFVGITPPDSPQYSVDKYISRDKLDIPYDDFLYEIRALTVVDQSRGTHVASALMYAAFRWAQAHGGRHLVAMGHTKTKDMYVRLGMQPIGEPFSCGALIYEPLAATMQQVEMELTRFAARLNRLENQIEWAIDVPFRANSECYHGGAFFDAIGDTFEHLERRNEIINADVLDAWFPPCPEALRALHEHMGWLMRTSPPNHAEGLTQTIADVRGVAPCNILTGGGSSPLIFLAFREWLTPRSRVLLLNPTYGEYSHVLKNVVGCTVDRFKLHRSEGYEVNTQRLIQKMQNNYDLVVLVNPNSPTGQHVARADVETLLKACPKTATVWIDETYVDYAEPNQSLEIFAIGRGNVVIVKSMSKVYGLSGLRAGYLCGTPKLLEPLRGLMPPWSVSLPAQVAAVKALRNPEYYREHYQQTHRLRAELVLGLQKMGIREIIPGMANFILFHLPEDGPDGETLIRECRERGLFIRDASEMGTDMSGRAIRIAVKNRETNKRMLQIMGAVLAIREVLHESVR